jgi:hypothetical protein
MESIFKMFLRFPRHTPNKQIFLFSEENLKDIIPNSVLPYTSLPGISNINRRYS